MYVFNCHFAASNSEFCHRLSGIGHQPPHVRGKVFAPLWQTRCQPHSEVLSVAWRCGAGAWVTVIKCRANVEMLNDNTELWRVWKQK